MLLTQYVVFFLFLLLSRQTTRCNLFFFLKEKLGFCTLSLTIRIFLIICNVLQHYCDNRRSLAKCLVVSSHVPTLKHKAKHGYITWKQQFVCFVGSESEKESVDLNTSRSSLTAIHQTLQHNSCQSTANASIFLYNLLVIIII